MNYREMFMRLTQKGDGIDVCGGACHVLSAPTVDPRNGLGDDSDTITCGKHGTAYEAQVSIKCVPYS